MQHLVGTWFGLVSWLPRLGGFELWGSKREVSTNIKYPILNNDFDEKSRICIENIGSSMINKTKPLYHSPQSIFNIDHLIFDIPFSKYSYFLVLRFPQINH